MAQSGLHIPAQSGSKLSIFKDVFADIGDEQSIEQSLSTFSSHVTNIIRILKKANVQTLVLLDELGAGTDPQDGAALAQGILTYLMEKRIPNLVATHYPALKSFAHVTPGTLNASMAFDLKSLRPTYRLNIGLPGKSNALLIAERLGMPLPIIETARDTFDPNEQQADNLLEEILRQRDQARTERQLAEESHQAADALNQRLQDRLDGIEEEKQRILAAAREDADKEIETLMDELEPLRRALRTKRDALAEIKALQSQLGDIQEGLERSRERKRKVETANQVPVQVGDRVQLRSLGMNGEIISVDGEDIEVQAGALRMRAQLSDIELVNKAGRVKKTKTAGSTHRHDGSISLVHPSPGMELDLRGQTSEEARESLQAYLEDAYLAGLHMVRIIHGKGTGRLRSVIRSALDKSGRVRSWEHGLQSEGGEGVTIARIRTE